MLNMFKDNFLCSAGVVLYRQKCDLCLDWFHFTFKFGNEGGEKEEREDLGAF